MLSATPLPVHTIFLVTPALFPEMTFDSIVVDVDPPTASAASYAAMTGAARPPRVHASHPAYPPALCHKH